MASSSANQELNPCNKCGRTFNPEALRKHSKICTKVFIKQRKVFDSAAARIVSSEQAQIMREAKRAPGGMGVSKKQNSQLAAKSRAAQNMPTGKPQKASWAAKSNMFRNAMRAARGAKPLGA